MWWTVTAFLVGLLGAHISGEDYHNELNETYPGYGRTWIYFPDGDGNSQVVNLTEPSSDVMARIKKSDKSVQFQLYTRNNLFNYSELVLEQALANTVKTDQPFDNKLFDTSKDVKIVTHGWRSSGLSSNCVRMKDAYLRDGDVNVIIVNWQDLASGYYIYSAHDTKVVGQKIAHLIDYLIDQYGMKLEQFHIIGHSLGAHVAGCAGNSVNSGKIGRITGLDPARPVFEIWPSTGDRLNADDAQFVDVVHTCAGMLGYSSPIGHADFYPNGGRPSQPGCKGLLLFMDWCSHSRAYELFTESIENHQGFIGVRCESSTWEGTCADPTHYQRGVSSHRKNVNERANDKNVKNQDVGKNNAPHLRVIPDGNDEEDYGDDVNGQDESCEYFKENSAVMGNSASSEARGIFYVKTNAHQPYAKCL